MFDDISELFQIDWRIFMAGTDAWLNGTSPYGQIGPEFGPGAFAYPPTALPWLAFFWLFGPLSFYLWTVIQLAGWWLLIRKDRVFQMSLLIWAPMVLHLVQGQSTLPVILVLWAATQAKQRTWLWGLAIAWALTKPQVALLPTLWLLWQDRNATTRWQFIGGMLGGTVALALPATLINPQIWVDWFASLPAYRARILQMTAWQGPSIVLLGFAAYLWHRSQIGGWQWWLTFALFPHTSFYDAVTLLPMLQPLPGWWSIGGLLLAGILQGPVSETFLPWILTGHVLAAWMLARGLQPRKTAFKLTSPQQPTRHLPP
jgi:hypothetical protein